MLADLALGLADGWRQVSVLARPGPRLEALAARRVNLGAVGVDYTRGAGLARALDNAKRERGEIDLAVCWVHSHAREAMDVITRAMSAGSRVIDVRSGEHGNAHADPVHEDLRARYPLLRWQAVRLGFKFDLGAGTPRARWLTHSEICAGVTSAIESHTSMAWVGLPPGTTTGPKA